MRGTVAKRIRKQMKDMGLDPKLYKGMYRRLKKRYGKN